MFKYWSIKKYGCKLLPCLAQKYGKQNFYSASQVRTIVYQKDFNPKYLPLGYILFINPREISAVFLAEFPHLNIENYKQELAIYLEKKRYQGFLKILDNAAV